MTRLWLLDFDGTLVDSEQAIKRCYLEVGQDLIPKRCSFIKTMLIGPTLDESSRMILTEKNLHLLDIFKNRFQELYDDKLILETPMYPHVDETLRQLHKQGNHLFIVTNKRAFPTHKLIDFYNWNNLFDWVACMDKYPSAQSKLDLLKLININQNQYEKIFFVGDTSSDGLTANSYGVPFIRANYGYGKSQKWKKISIFKEINKFNEILNI